MNYWKLFSISVVLFFLQGSFLPSLLFGKWQPDIFLTVLIIFSLIFEKKEIFAFAVVFGLIQDLIIGNFFGLHIFPYVIISWFIVQFIKEKYNKHWYVSFISVLIGSFVYFLMSSFIVWQSGYNYLTDYYLVLGVPFVLCNGLIALFLHKLLWKFKQEKEIRW